MAASDTKISKMTFDGTTYTLKDANSVHYSDSWIEPLLIKTYTGSFYGTGDNNTSNCFYFLYIKPDEWYKPWHVKLKFTTTCTASSSYYSTTWCDLYGRADGITYHNFNELYTSAHYYVAVNRVNSNGYNNSYRHAIGINIRYSTNYTSSSYPRTFYVEYYGCEDCTVTFLDAPIKYNALEGYDTSKTYRVSTDGCSDNLDAYNRGLRESGDDNSYANVVDNYYQLRAVGVNGLYGRNICTVDEDDKISGLTLSYSTATGHTANSVKFKVGAQFWYFNSTGSLLSGGKIGTGTMRLVENQVDFRYSSNCGQTLTGYTPVYLIGIPDSTNPSLYTLDTTTWYTQTLPTTEDGKIYIYMGTAYTATTTEYRISWAPNHEIYWYKNGALRNYIPAETANYATYLGTSATNYTQSSLSTALSGKAPTSHASTATTYGAGTTTNYGHVKLISGDLKSTTYADGAAAASSHTHSQYLTSSGVTLTETASSSTTTDTLTVDGSSLSFALNGTTLTITFTSGS